jgi:hypothetical protein
LHSSFQDLLIPNLRLRMLSNNEVVMKEMEWRVDDETTPIH